MERENDREMFKGVIETGILKEWIEAIIAINDEGKITINEEGWQVTVSEMANVAMIDTTLPKEVFAEYEYQESEDDGVGVDFTKLLNMLNTIKNDGVTIEITNSELELNTDIYRYTFRLIDLDALRRTHSAPELEFKIEETINTNEFRNVIRGADKIGEEIELSIENSILKAKTKDDNETMIWSFECENEHDITLVSRYSIEYLLQFLKPIKSDKITLHLNDKYPLKISFELDNGIPKAEYILSPRIEPE